MEQEKGEKEKISNYEEMSLKELKEKCKEYGISIGKNKRQELIDALKEHAVSSSLPEKKHILEYESMNLKELKEKCKEYGISIGKKKKQELMDALKEYYEQEEMQKEEEEPVKGSKKRICGYCLQKIPGPDHSECVLQVGGEVWEKTIREIEEEEEEEFPRGDSYDMYLIHNGEDMFFETKEGKEDSRFLHLLEK